MTSLLADSIPAKLVNQVKARPQRATTPEAALRMEHLDYATVVLGEMEEVLRHNLHGPNPFSEMEEALKHTASVKVIDLNEAVQQHLVRYLWRAAEVALTVMPGTLTSIDPLGLAPPTWGWDLPTSTEKGAELNTAEVSELVVSIERLCRVGKEQQAMDRLLDVLESHLRCNRFLAVDRILTQLDPSRVAVGVTLVALTITSYGRERLAAREKFFVRASAAVRDKLGSKRADRLLASRR